MAGAHKLDGFELIVHIGTGKAGSSSIQKTLASNGAGLGKQGVRYIGMMAEEAPEKLYVWQRAGGWPELMAAGLAAGEQQLRQALVTALGQFADLGAKRAIWSNESIFGNDRLVIPVLKHLESLGVRNRIIVYIRRHDAWVRSAYLQWGIKHKTYPGPVKPFREWYSSQKISFLSGLRPWLAQEWAEIAVRNFDACDDVVADFLQYFGLDSEDIVPRWDNETPNAVALALWAIFNSQSNTPVLPVELQRLLIQSGILQKMPVECSLHELLPTDDEIEAVKVDLEPDRAEINKIFRQFGQPDMATSALKPKQMTVSQGQINAALLLMIKQQGDQINSLRKKVRDLSGVEQDDRV